MKIFERKMVTQELEIENSCYNELKKSIFPTKFQFPLSSVRSVLRLEYFFEKVSVQFAC